MARKRYTAEEIIRHLRTVEIDLGKGSAGLDACRQIGITEHILPLEAGIRRAARRPSEAPESLGAGESTSDTDRGEPSLGALDSQGSRLGKLRSPARQREAVGHAVTVLHVSECRACRAIGQVRSSSRYPAGPEPGAGARAAHCARQGVWTVGVSDGHGSRETGGRGRGASSGGYELAAGRAPSAAAATQTSPALACRRVVPPAAASVSPSRLVVGLRGRSDTGRSALSDL